MKRISILILICCVVFAGCGRAAQSEMPVNYTDVFHQQVGGLTLDLTPPDAWNETVCSYNIAYCFLDHEKLEETLKPEITTETVNLRDEEAGDPDYYMEILSGSDGMGWVIREDTPVTSTMSIYTYGNEEPFPTSSEFVSGAVEQIAGSLQMAQDFLSGIGLNSVELRGYHQEGNTVLMRFSYMELDDIPTFDPCAEVDWTPFLASEFEVAVEEDHVRYASITYPYEIVSEGESEACLSPEQAVAHLIDWYEESADGGDYSFDTITLCWAITARSVEYGEKDTAQLSPYWVFLGTHEQAQELIAVNAISGELLQRDMS